jgi:hypothetical protein
MQRQLSVLSLALTVSLAITACSPTTSPEAVAQFCKDVKVLQSNVNDINNLPPTASKDDIKAAAAKVEDSAQAARNSFQAVKTVDVNEFRNAYDVYTQNLYEVANYSDPTTFGQKFAAFKVNTAKLKMEVDNVYTGAKCV